MDRTAIEYRMFDNNQSNITRLRNRFGFRYDFTEKLKLSIYDELLFNLSGTTQHHFFDHDRIGLTLEFKVLPYLKFDIGYIHIARLPLTSTTKLHENNIFLNLTYQLQKRTKEGQHPTPVTVAQPLFSQTNFPQSFSLLLYFGVNHQPPIDLRNLIAVVYRVW